jgi:hypothetical protein
MIRIFYSQKTEHLIKKLEFLPEAKILEDDVSIAMKNGYYTGIKIIKKITNYLKRLI